MNGLNLTFSQLAAGPLPGSIGGCFSGLYRPTDYESASGGIDAWPGVPSGPHAADFDRFIGGKPNGEWKLYVVDDDDTDSGNITQGWVLTIIWACVGRGGRNQSPVARRRPLTKLDANMGCPRGRGEHGASRSLSDSNLTI